MQFIFLLIVLFAICCALYGIAEGVQMVRRGLAWLSGSGAGRNVAPMTPVPNAQMTGFPPALKSSSLRTDPVRGNVNELRELFALYRQGALTQEEFEKFKKQLLSTI